MHKVDPTGRNWAAEIEYRHHGYVVKIDTVLSGGWNVYYDIFGPDDAHVGGVRSLREAAEVIDEHRQGEAWLRATGERAMALLPARVVRHGRRVESDSPSVAVPWTCVAQSVSSGRTVQEIAPAAAAVIVSECGGASCPTTR